MTRRKDKRPLRILVIGPLSSTVGGTTVSMRVLLNALAELPSVQIDVLKKPASRHSRFYKITQSVGFVHAFVHKVKAVDVVTLHCSISSLPLAGPVVVAICWMKRTPLIIRQFGGRCFHSLPLLRRLLASWTVRHCSLFLMETHSQVAQARSCGFDNVQWFANYRAMPQLVARKAIPKCSRFVFLGHVIPAKGIRELMAAAEALPGEGPLLDIYGPLCNGIDANAFSCCRRVRYMGTLQPQEVAETLRQYHALVFPTYYSGEGYPGVILEAYAAGLPVISTRWRAIPEIVDGTTGLLIPPQDACALREAMEQLMRDQALYAQLCRGVRQKRIAFSTEHWVHVFAQYCKCVLESAG